jgi:N,N'-diacetylchitobiose phosphorylase
MRYGYFDQENREYVVERPDVPVSWTNYLGVKDLAAVISHNAGGYAFYKTAQHHRITRFRQNGVPLDRPGHYVYLRDDDSADYWSLSWQPVGKPLDQATYECRHGLSYSHFRTNYSGIEAVQTLFIPVDDDVELWSVRVRNTGDRPRRLSVFGYCEFSFHHIDIDNQNLQMSLYASGTNYRDGILEYDFFYEPWTYHYFTSNVEPDSFDGLRDSFIGPYRTETNPIAVETGRCSNSTELGGNHCGGLHKSLGVLEPGQEARIVFMLGVGSREEAGRAMRAKYSSTEAVDQAFAELKAYWEEKCAKLQVSTPHEGLDSMINTWTLFQAETCVVWSRFASFIEVGGRTGLGYRDTAQDCMSVPHTNPEACRRRIEELLQGQVEAGYGLHLFDPEWFKPQENKLPGVKLPTVVPTPSASDMIHGMEDVCSDDHLWLIPTIAEYVKETGDLSFFDHTVPYAEGTPATVYEHMKRGLDFTADQRGSNGICLGLRADWNDCLNLGGGQSALTTFLFRWALIEFVAVAQRLGRRADAERYQALAEEVREACERELWDGEWYLRGFTRKGLKIGSKENEEGKIFLEHMGLGVMGGVGSKHHAEIAMDSVDRHLFSEFGLHLCWPTYTKPDDDIGYLTRVYQGIKENGAIFSHPNAWPIIAECQLGRGDRAMKFYDAILPWRQNDQIETRQAEPYSYCQFIMGKDHTAFGRARHPWLTGTGGWMYTAVTKWILGVRPDFDGLIIDPCIPQSWSGFEVQRQWRGAHFHIEVRNPRNVSKGVVRVELNGQLVKGAIPVQAVGTKHRIVVELG